MSKARVLIWIFSFHVLAVQGILLADESQEFNRSLISVYSFQPHTLTADEITAKSKELDKFWDMVEADPPRYLLLLRQALADATNPSFFFYDGSKLLLSLSSEREDQEIALQAIPRGDLRDIQHRDYLTTVAQLASRSWRNPNFKSSFPNTLLPSVRILRSSICFYLRLKVIT
jgi:hypothetical protein